MIPNIPLLRKVVEWVEEQEQLTKGRVWDQWSYYAYWEQQSPWCRTSMCVAGKVAWDAGWRPVWGVESPLDGWETPSIEKDGTTAFASVVGAELLCLTQSQAENLFAADNDAADIRRIAESIAGERL